MRAIEVASGKQVNVELARQSITKLLSANRLCAIATVGKQRQSPAAHVSTAFYCYDDRWNLFVLTAPGTDHGANLAMNTSVAVAIYSTSQQWDNPKQGLQFFGTAAIEEGADLEVSLDLYFERYPGLRNFITSGAEIEKIDSRLYRLKPHRIRIFDEPGFGSETWIDVMVE